ncbi:MAG TPA: calcium/proton exchanger [Gemmatimonadaceae bacterium]|nr:calcium/proton exchanger [Gemmatimonadaceae bacterium]
MSWLRWLLLAAPVALVGRVLHAPPLVVFATSAIAIIPLSQLLGQATEELAEHTGPTVGGLLNATLGNLAELIIAAFALRAGLVELVKASITGSILGNLLLVLGLSQLAGGLRYQRQRFNPQLAGMSAALLVIAVVGLVVPALFLAMHPDPARVATIRLSEGVAVLLIVGYGLSLVYSMWTHRDVFRAVNEEEGGAHAAVAGWSKRKSLLVLGAAAVGIGVLSELLVGATEGATHALGLSQLFVGIVVIPVIGNAAEHSSAVMMAMKNRMDLAVGIAVGSSIQVSLLVAPLLVFGGLILGQPMDLAFAAFEVAAVALAVGIATVIVLDAESNWLEGALLLVVYGVLAVAFYFF